ncbi:MAG: toxin-antitoxin system HicB family antitoxin [Thermomicrobiales bacterium]
MATTALRPLKEYLALDYPFNVVADPDGGYVIIFPDLPGCMSQVDTIAEVGSVAEEIRILWIETEYERGEEIPLPSYPEEYSGKFNVRLPRSLHRRLVEAAECEDISLNQHVVALLSQGSAGSVAELRLAHLERGQERTERLLSDVAAHVKQLNSQIAQYHLERFQPIDQKTAPTVTKSRRQNY